MTYYLYKIETTDKPKNYTSTSVNPKTKLHTKNRRKQQYNFFDITITKRGNKYIFNIYKKSTTRITVIYNPSNDPK